MATLARYESFAQDVQGNVIPGATVEVRKESDSSLATVYSDRAGTLPIGNPFLSAGDGLIAFHAFGGAYKITVTKGNITRIFRYVPIGTLQEYDFPTAREVLTADRTYFVRTDGNDNNLGTSDTAGGAFLTIQKAVNVVWDTIDIAGKNVTIQVRDGTYTGQVAKFYDPVGGEPLLQGNTTTPANCVISVTGADALDFRRGALISIQGFKITTTTSGRGIHVSGDAQLNIIGNMDFGACVGGHIACEHLGKIGVQAASYTISGGGPYHMQAGASGHISASSTGTITLSGTPAFTTGFVVANTNGIVQLAAVTTFSGSATGPKYRASLNGVILVSNSYAFPGSTPGQLHSGGVIGPDPGGTGTYSVFAHSTANSAVTGTTNETTLATITIPANSMGPNGRLKVTTTWSYTNSANAKSLRVRLNGIGGTAFLTGSVTTTDTAKYETEIYNKGATNSQECFSAPSAQGGWGTSTAAIITGAIDTTADRDIVITGQLVNTGETITLKNYKVEILYGP